MPAAVFRVAVPEVGWSHPLELLGCIHPNMAVEAPGHHRGLSGHRGVGAQPPVQVGTRTHGTDIGTLGRSCYKHALLVKASCT